MTLSWILLFRICTAHFRSSKVSQIHRQRISAPLQSLNMLSALRGGSAESSAAGNLPVISEEKQYKLKQQLYLQSRSTALRQALISRGLLALSHQPDETALAQPIDWDCALSTADYPKSCLISLDAEENSKVIGPMDGGEKWISLRAFNRLRRTDPTKIEVLWHQKYAILSTWCSPSHMYSLYSFLTPQGALLSWLLDTPGLLTLAVLTSTLVALLITLPFWEGLVRFVVTSEALWMNWANWGRFVHATLPLKRGMRQYIMKFVLRNVGKIVGRVRTYLVEVECDLLERCTPLTIIDGEEEVEESPSEEEVVGALDDVDEGSSED